MNSSSLSARLMLPLLLVLTILLLPLLVLILVLLSLLFLPLLLVNLCPKRRPFSFRRPGSGGAVRAPTKSPVPDSLISSRPVVDVPDKPSPARSRERARRLCLLNRSRLGGGGGKVLPGRADRGGVEDG